MDGLQFDAWTRRRFGLAAGSIGAWLFGLTALVEVEAKGKGKKKRRKKRRRCKKLRSSCSPGGKKCCKGNLCSGFNGGFHCCKPGDKSCTDDEECCSDNCRPEGVCAPLIQ